MKRRTKALIKNIEDSRIGLPVFLLSLASIIFVRLFIEGLVTDPQGFMPLNHLHHFSCFFLSAFLSSILLISSLSKERVDKVSKVILSAYSIIILPPIIDFFTSKEVYYAYIFDPTLPFATPNWRFLLKAYLTFCSDIEGVMPGLKIEIIVLLILSTLYVLHKTRSTPRTILTPIAVYTLIFFYGTFPNYFYFGTLHETFNSSHNMLYLSSVFTVFISLQSMLWLSLYNTKKFLEILKNLRAKRAIHYLAMAGIGVFLAGHGYYTALLALLCILFAWQTALTINDIHDKSVDEISKKTTPLTDGIVTITEMKAVAMYCALLSLLFASILSYAATIIILFYIALSTLYSTPPLRLKRYPLLSTLLLASEALLAFALGFYSGPPQREFPTNLAYAFLVCFTLAFNTKDLKDYEGDKENRIWTIPVIFGPKNGRRIIAALDLLAFMAVPLILDIKKLQIPSMVFGIATFLVVLREECKEWQVFLLYFLFLALLLIIK